MPFEESISKFFVRLSGTAQDNSAKVGKAFGSLTPVDAGYSDEFAFITEAMTEGTFRKAAEETGNVINKIRIDA